METTCDAQVCGMRSECESRRFSHKHQRCTITSKRLSDLLGLLAVGGSLFIFLLSFYLFFRLFSSSSSSSSFFTSIATHCVRDEKML